MPGLNSSRQSVFSSFFIAALTFPIISFTSSPFENSFCKIPCALSRLFLIINQRGLSGIKKSQTKKRMAGADSIPSMPRHTSSTNINCKADEEKCAVCDNDNKR